MQRRYYVYIMASKSRVLYTGVTGNLQRRVLEHKHDTEPGFTTSGMPSLEKRKSRAGCAAKQLR